MKKEELSEILDKHSMWLRSEPDGVRADLSGVYLSGADLSGADLASANLTDAKLTDAKLNGANLAGAKLNGANLAGANLAYANLTDAKLTGAKLIGAELIGAKLTGAKLIGANLADANIDFSAWPLWCGSLRVGLDMRQKKQLLYHAFAVCLDGFPGGLTDEQKDWINGFHRVVDGSVEKIK